MLNELLSGIIKSKDKGSWVEGKVQDRAAGPAEGAQSRARSPPCC